MGLIKALQEKGYDIVVITPVDDFINFIYESGIKYVPLYKLTRKSKNPIRDYILYNELVSVYNRVKPDLVIQYTIKPNIYGGLAAKKLGIKTLSVIPGLGHAFVDQSWLQQITRILYKKSLKHSSKVVFENKSDAEFFVSQNIIQQHQAEAFKGCGVDTSHFAPMIANDRSEGRIFLYMGRLILEKGIHEFVEAARLIAAKEKEVAFWIIGHIDEENPSAIPKDEFLKWIEHPKIKYLGFKQDVRQIIADADCIVLPSYYPEGIPRVLQEAMAMEKAIITTDTNGCREAVDDGINGFLAQPRSSADLFRQMGKITRMADKSLKEMGRKGRQKAMKEFDESISVRRYLELVGKILS
jgi:glycosyltransferase involved in cell wall biosynthesis